MKPSLRVIENVARHLENRPWRFMCGREARVPKAKAAPSRAGARPKRDNNQASMNMAPARLKSASMGAGETTGLWRRPSRHRRDACFQAADSTDAIDMRRRGDRGSKLVFLLAKSRQLTRASAKYRHQRRPWPATHKQREGQHFLMPALKSRGRSRAYI